MTSDEAAQIYDDADGFWFRLPRGGGYTLRQRLDDSERSKWKHRFCARAVLLIAYWRRRVAERAAAVERAREAREGGYEFKAKRVHFVTHRPSATMRDRVTVCGRVLSARVGWSVDARAVSCEKCLKVMGLRK